MAYRENKQPAQKCSICQNTVHDGLGKHIISRHGYEALKRLIIQAKTDGVSDAELGQRFGINLRQLEKIIIESYGLNISGLVLSKKSIKCWEPKDFREETTTVWSFKQRGNWATHNGKYRGNWSPYIPRNVILKYSKPGDLVLDYFAGSGTTAVEAKLLGRRCIALDINPACVSLTKQHLDFNLPSNLFSGKMSAFEPEVRIGDARNLGWIPDGSVDLICAHPPYAGIIKYGSKIEGDLSNLGIAEFLLEIEKVAQESFRVLKLGGKCAILIGDTRRKKHILPLGFQTIDVFLRAGFRLKELVIKRQYNCKTTGFWYDKSVQYNFLLLAHEYLPIFEKVPMVLTSLPTVVYEVGSVTTSTEWVFKKFRPKKVNELETSTVWSFRQDELEERVNENVFRRYGEAKDRLIVYINPETSYSLGSVLKIKGKLGLLFIKANSLQQPKSQAEVERYIKVVETGIKQQLPHIASGGHLVIQVKDVRVAGYIEPMAKNIISLLEKNQRLWLKEIVIVVGDNQGDISPKPDGEELKIVHQYLLIYDVKK
uniref:Methyltransferase domain-containing protein n=1 Tax=candidate division WOR-3 bacterium TaxID=2052148 RepID=A0A7C3ER90_UNCW3